MTFLGVGMDIIHTICNNNDDDDDDKNSNYNNVVIVFVVVVTKICFTLIFSISGTQLFCFREEHVAARKRG